MTHSIAPDTVNVSVNLLKAERTALGQLAVLHDQSIGGLIRNLIYRGLEANAPKTAAELAELRRKRRAAVLLACGMLAWGAQFLDSSLEFRRPGRAPSVCRAKRLELELA